MAQGKEWNLERLSFLPREAQKKGKGMYEGNHARMILNVPLKQAARQFRTARW
jgi:hypothetical protein